MGPQGTTYLVGELVGSAAGGVDHDFVELPSPGDVPPVPEPQ